jgi:hypothetical protein
VPAAIGRHFSKSMIPKSGHRFSDKIMLNERSWSGMTVRRNVIAL